MQSIPSAEKDSYRMTILGDSTSNDFHHFSLDNSSSRRNIYAFGENFLRKKRGRRGGRKGERGEGEKGMAYVMRNS